jgi:leader peptidase (prepilin peptidase) / N-methyltransferase
MNTALLLTYETLAVVVLAWLGLSVGSFLNVVIHRLPRKSSVVRPGSRCPGCGYELRWFDNIPVLSWLFLKGRCRKCRTPISIRYPIVEILTMLVFLLHWWVFGWTVLLWVRIGFACALIALFAIDLEHHLLPDRITLPGVAVGLIVSLIVPPGILDAILGTILGGGVLWAIGEAYYRYSGQEGMGGGDVKMLAMVGAFLGWKLVLVTLVLSSVTGSLIGMTVIAARRGDMKYALPYGTFLAAAALLASLVGDRIVAWYTGLYAGL